MADRPTLARVAALCALACLASPQAHAADDALTPIAHHNNSTDMAYLTVRCSSFMGAVFIYRHMLRSNKFYGPAGRDNTDHDWIDDSVLRGNLEAARHTDSPKNYKYTQKYLKAFGAVTTKPVLVGMALYQQDKATCLDHFGANAQS